MWLISRGGMYSVVKKGNKYQIRCRLQHEYDNLKKLLKDDKSAAFLTKDYKHDGYFDYKYRAITDTLDVFMKSIQDEITYDNFKNHIHSITDRPSSYNRLYYLIYNVIQNYSNYSEAVKTKISSFKHYDKI